MEYTHVIVGIIIVFAIIYFCTQNTEHMASDGGALIQLAAKGPMDEYLIPNARKYSHYPYYYNARPKRAWRFYDWFNPYSYYSYNPYPYYPRYPYTQRPFL